MNNSVIIYITHLPIIKLIHSIILVFITELCVWINERPTFLIITNHIVLFRILTIPLLYLFYSLPNPVFRFVFLSAQINPNLQSLNIFFLNLNKTATIQILLPVLNPYIEYAYWLCVKFSEQFSWQNISWCFCLSR